MAGEKGGKDWLLYVESTHGSGTYTLLGGLRSTGFTRNAEEIDVTNQGSNQERELLDGAGIKTREISGSGVFTNSTTLTYVEDRHESQALTRFRVADVDSGRQYTSLFKITSVERTGDYNNEQGYSISLSSSGALTVS
jgi:TP901-1 family phage major tail protein